MTSTPEVPRLDPPRPARPPRTLRRAVLAGYGAAAAGGVLTVGLIAGVEHAATTASHTTTTSGTAASTSATSTPTSTASTATGTASAATSPVSAAQQNTPAVAGSNGS